MGGTNFLKLYELYDMPKDPMLGEQWHLNNAENVAHISAFDAWQITTGTRDTVIAVVDSGTDLEHPDIAPNLVGGFDALGNDDDRRQTAVHSLTDRVLLRHVQLIAPTGESHGTAVSGVGRWRL